MQKRGILLRSSMKKLYWKKATPSRRPKKSKGLFPVLIEFCTQAVSSCCNMTGKKSSQRRQKKVSKVLQPLSCVFVAMAFATRLLFSERDWRLHEGFSWKKHQFQSLKIDSVYWTFFKVCKIKNRQVTVINKISIGISYMKCITYMNCITFMKYSTKELAHMQYLAEFSR